MANLVGIVSFPDLDSENENETNSVYEMRSCSALINLGADLPHLQLRLASRPLAGEQRDHVWAHTGSICDGNRD